MADEEKRREINRLYWGSDASVGEISDRLGVSRRALYDGIEPAPADQPCPDCGGRLGFRNRTAAENRAASCPDCGRELKLTQSGGSAKRETPDATARPAADPEVERQARGAALAPMPPRSIPSSAQGAALGGAMLAGLAVGAALGYLARRP